MLSQVGCRKILTFLHIWRQTNGMQNWFPESQTIFRKNAPLKAWRSWISTMYVMIFCCHKEDFQKPIMPCHSAIHVRVFLIHHDFPHVYLFESHTFFFLIFILSFSFWIKPFSFLSMTTLLCYPCHKIVWPWYFSSIVLPLIMYNSCWLMWDSLSPTFQQALPHRPQHLIRDRD